MKCHMKRLQYYLKVENVGQHKMIMKVFDNTNVA
jgi:hypothetical protein